MKKIVVATSGASGVGLVNGFIKNLPNEYEVHFIKSKNAAIVNSKEGSNVVFHDEADIAASIASGSFGAHMMAIIPTSMNTLAKISCGIADNLVCRAASVMLKERRTLLLAPREMPFSPIDLENMHKLSQLGVIIAPPVVAYYSQIKTLEDMENFLIGKWYDQLGIEHDLFKRWQG
ncbi:MAG: UbiX family flavin prenyltransferase [Campylobacterota bacterium]